MEQATFYSLSANEQITLAAILAIILSDGLTADQLGILGNFFEALGQNLLLTQAIVPSQPAEPSPASSGQAEEPTLASLQKEIELLKAKVTELSTC